jgi:hypothetical protein
MSCVGVSFEFGLHLELRALLCSTCKKVCLCSVTCDDVIYKSIQIGECAIRILLGYIEFPKTRASVGDAVPFFRALV